MNAPDLDTAKRLVEQITAHLGAARPYESGGASEHVADTDDTAARLTSLRA